MPHPNSLSRLSLWHRPSRAWPAPQPPPRPDHSAPDFDHFDHSDTAGLPRPDPDSDGVRVTPAHAALHGLARPAVTLGIATPIRPGPRARSRTRMASESAQATSLRPGRAQPLAAPAWTRTTTPNPARCHNTEVCQLWTCRSTTWQVRGISRRSNHVNLTYYARARRLHGRPTSQRGKVSLFGSARRLHTAPTLFGM
jgi:hypothetical protein